MTASGAAAAARAFARIIDEVNRLPLRDLQRPPQPYPSRIDVASCPAWIKASSAACTDNAQRVCAVAAAGC